MSIQNDVEKLYRSDLEKQRQKQKKKKKKKLLGIMLIVISCLFLIPSQTYNTVTQSRHYLILIFSSLSYAIFAINIVFLYLILIFLVHSLRKSIECNIDDWNIPPNHTKRHVLLQRTNLLDIGTGFFVNY